MDRKTLTYRETWLRMGISRATFFALKASGIFDKLESPIPHRYSTERVDAWLASRPVSSAPLAVSA